MGNTNDETKPTDTVEGDNSRTTAHVEATTPISLQPFWQNNPRTWFQLAEIQFDAAKVPAMTRYTKTLSALPNEICDRIPDILAEPPKQNHYQVLRDRLIERLAISDEQQLEKLLAGEQWGDRKPSEVLGRIQTLAGNNFSSKIVRSLWVRRMPPLIKLALVGHDNIDISESARTADKMYEILPATNTINEMSTQPSHRTSRSPVKSYRSNLDGNRRPPNATIEDRLARIEARLDRILPTRLGRSRERRFPSRTRSNTNSKSRERPLSRGPINGVCWFHARFGTQARRCRQPCKFGQSTSKAAMDIDEVKNS